MKVRMSDGEERDVHDERALELVNTGAARALDPDAVVEVPSHLVAEADARAAYAETEYATPQEKRQAAVEREGLASGSHARLHQTQLPALAVADEGHAQRIELDGEELYRNKGVAAARPDSAGYAGVPDASQGRAVTAVSGPAPDQEVKAKPVKLPAKATEQPRTEGDTSDVSVKSPAKAAPAKAADRK